MATMKEATRKAQLTIVTGMVILSLLLNQRVFLYVAGALGLVFLASPSGGTMLVTWWLKLGHALGWVNTRILLTLIYVFILLPFSLLFKLLSRNPLLLKPEGCNTFFREKNHTYTAKDLRDMW
jgi:hypothetical protein